MLDWSLLRSFLAVVDTGSLSAAATRIGGTQPTIGRHVRELETALGVSLFRRSVKGLEPTEAAIGLINDARIMGAAADALALKAQGKAETLKGTVRITASVIIANLVLPSVIAALRRAEPMVQIEIVASDVSQNLLRRDADIALRMFDPTQNALIARRIGESAIGLFAARSYLADHEPPRNLAGLLDHDVIGFDRSDLLIRGYAAYGHSVTRNQFAVRCDDQMVCWNLLLSGAGLGFAQTRLGEAQSLLQPVDIGITFPPLPMWLVMHEEVRSNAHIRRVADFLGDALGAWLRGANNI